MGRRFRKCANLLFVPVVMTVLACGGARRLADVAAFPRPPLRSGTPQTASIPLGEDATGILWVVRNEQCPWSVLYFHGNGEDLHDLRGIVRGLARHATVYAVDYRGYGCGRGTPSVGTFEADARAFYDAAVRLGAEPSRLVVQGYSIGGAAAVEVAASRRVAGLLLGSTFTSLLGVPWFGRFLPVDWFRSEDKLRGGPEGRGVACPVRIYHGTADRLIDFSHGERLFAAAPEPKVLVPLEGEDHISAHRQDGAQLAAFLAWLEALQ